MVCYRNNPLNQITPVEKLIQIANIWLPCIKYFRRIVLVYKCIGVSLRMQKFMYEQV